MCVYAAPRPRRRVKPQCHCLSTHIYPLINTRAAFVRSFVEEIISCKRYDLLVQSAFSSFVCVSMSNREKTSIDCVSQHTANHLDQQENQTCHLSYGSCVCVHIIRIMLIFLNIQTSVGRFEFPRLKPIDKAVDTVLDLSSVRF